MLVLGAVQSIKKRLYTQSTLFSGYRVESHANNVINMAMQLEYLLRATRAAQQSTDISISLRRKGGQPILSWSMTSDVRV